MFHSPGGFLSGIHCSTFPHYWQSWCFVPLPIPTGLNSANNNELVLFQWTAYLCDKSKATFHRERKQIIYGLTALSVLLRQYKYCKTGVNRLRMFLKMEFETRKRLFHVEQRLSNQQATVWIFGGLFIVFRITSRFWMAKLEMQNSPKKGTTDISCDPHSIVFNLQILY